jgi:hypothetical protein
MIKKGKNMSNVSEVFDNLNEELNLGLDLSTDDESNEGETFWVPEDGYTLVPLHSVGTVLCSQAGTESPVKVGTTYPMLVDGGWDEGMDCHLDEIENDEWFDNLSVKDKVIVDEVLETI